MGFHVTTYCQNSFYKAGGSASYSISPMSLFFIVFYLIFQDVEKYCTVTLLGDKKVGVLLLCLSLFLYFLKCYPFFVLPSSSSSLSMSLMHGCLHGKMCCQISFSRVGGSVSYFTFPLSLFFIVFPLLSGFGVQNNEKECQIALFGGKEVGVL